MRLAFLSCRVILFFLSVILVAPIYGLEISEEDYDLADMVNPPRPPSNPYAIRFHECVMQLEDYLETLFKDCQQPDGTSTKKVVLKFIARAMSGYAVKDKTWMFWLTGRHAGKG